MHFRGVGKAESESQRPLVHGLLSSYEHIACKKLSVPSFRKFWDDVMLYETKEMVKLPVTSLVDTSVREHLISKNRTRLNDAKFFALTHKELYHLMQKEFAPPDRIEFMKLLEKNVQFEFSAHFRPTPEYFKPFYDAVLLYCTSFRKIYEILAFELPSDRIIPPCNNKPHGLIKAFVSKIPYEYGTNVLLLMDKDKWENIYKFIANFTEILNEHLADGERARKLRRAFGGTQYEAKKFTAEQKLHMLQEMQQSKPPEEDAEWWYESMAAAEEELEDEVDMMLAALQQPQAREHKPFDRNAPPKDPLVCITKLLYGTCTKAGCVYSHREDLVGKKRLHYRELIDKQLAAAQPTKAQRPQPPARVSVLEDIYDDPTY